jgi:YbbR domain-containing protein
MLIMDAKGRSVRLRVKATLSTFKTIGFRKPKPFCQFDLSGLGQGTHSLNVQGAHVILPDGVSLVGAITRALTIRLEKKIIKTVNVLAELKGDPAPGGAVVAVHLKPDRIRLAGTAAMLAGLDTVKTLPINLKGASESFKKEVPLDLPEALIVEPFSRIVVAEIDIGERLITRRLGNIPITAKGKTSGFRIEPTGITLAISGPEALVGEIESNPAFSVTIDLEDVAPGSHFLKAAIKLPLHTTLVQVTPELFSVTISK